MVLGGALGRLCPVAPERKLRRAVPDHCIVLGNPKLPTTPHRTLGAFIASERLRAGLTQQDVVAALDQLQQWLSRIESGSRQRVDVVELLVLADLMTPQRLCGCSSALRSGVVSGAQPENERSPATDASFSHPPRASDALQWNPLLTRLF